jgi:secondary thiamine-phosphate synthase enzyme
MEKLQVKTAQRQEFIDITERLQKAVTRSGIQDGICHVFCPHTTAGLTINENADPSVSGDILRTMEKLIPADAGYAHAEGNSDSHIKSSIFGSSLSVFIEKGALCLGTWQGIYLCESDGPRSREVWVKCSRSEPPAYQR